MLRNSDVLFFHHEREIENLTLQLTKAEIIHQFKPDYVKTEGYIQKTKLARNSLLPLKTKVSLPSLNTYKVSPFLLDDSSDQSFLSEHAVGLPPTLKTCREYLMVNA